MREVAQNNRVLRAAMTFLVLHDYSNDGPNDFDAIHAIINRLIEERSLLGIYPSKQDHELFAELTQTIDGFLVLLVDCNNQIKKGL